jgi:hypothetical protein
VKSSIISKPLKNNPLCSGVDKGLQVRAEVNGHGLICISFLPLKEAWRIFNNAEFLGQTDFYYGKKNLFISLNQTYICSFSECKNSKRK